MVPPLLVKIRTHCKNWKNSILSNHCRKYCYCYIYYYNFRYKYKMLLLSERFTLHSLEELFWYVQNGFKFFHYMLKIFFSRNIFATPKLEVWNFFTCSNYNFSMAHIIYSPRFSWNKSSTSGFSISWHGIRFKCTPGINSTN